MMDTVLLMLRVGLSLAAVLGLLWWLSRRAQSSLGNRRRQQTVAVIGRQQFNKRVGIALVEVEGRRLVVGYSDQGVALVHDAGDAPPEPVEAPADAVPVDLSTLDATAPFNPTSADEHLHGATNLVPPVDTTARHDALSPAQTTKARMADARRHRSPLEGSILAPDTWRKAVVAVQERTTRRT